jgi:septal ring factor EnvC (AmiA/AmiB activator)
MGFLKPKPPKGPSPQEIAEANRKAREEAEARAKEEAANAEREAQARFAASDERQRQLKRTGKRKLIASPYGYLGVQEDFTGTNRNLLT